MRRLVFILMVFPLLASCSTESAVPTTAPTPILPQANASDAVAQGYVTPVRRSDLAFQISGPVAEILVKEGDQVKAGQPLVKLEDADLKARLAQAQAELASLQAGSRLEEIAQAQANLDAANAQVKATEIDLKRVRNGTQQAADIAAAQAQVAQTQAQLKSVTDAYDSILANLDSAREYGRGVGKLSRYEEQMRIQLAAVQTAHAVTQQQLTQAQASEAYDIRSAQAHLAMVIGLRDAAQAQLNLLKAGSRLEQIQIAQARVTQAQAALDEATLRAPFDATIAELAMNPGEMVSSGTPVVNLADLTSWEVDTDDLREVSVVNVRPGADVSIKVDALPGKIFQGRVKSITPRSVVKRGDVTYTVKVVISDPDLQLKWGMTAFVDIK